jgi:bla regulator protein BlaR1
MKRILLAVTFWSTLPAQAPRAFEVASIKPTNASDNRVAFTMQPGGRFNATNVTVKMLLQNAYGVRDFQISGGPGWIGSERFDITAKLDGDVTGPLPPGALRPALQGLFEDRFQLKFHRETREMPVYALMLAKNGPKLQKAAGEKTPGPMLRMGRGQLTAKNADMRMIAEQLAQQLGRSVVDKTGLSGEFDFELNWTPEAGSGGPFGPEPGAAPPPVDSSGPSIFTALQEQLGLRLESQRGPVEILVIDRLERPSEN